MVCGATEREYLCKKCRDNISKAPDREFSVDFKKNKAFSGLFYLGDYKDVLKNNILEFKINKNKMKLNDFAESIYTMFSDEINRVDYITYVPGFEEKPFHTSGVAEKLSQFSGKPVIKLLVKIKKNKSQKELSGFDRKNNVSGVFKINSEIKIKKHSKILLFDDIITTGSTVNEVLKVINDFQVSVFSLGVTCSKSEEK